jgi:hypothetical protein
MDKKPILASLDPEQLVRLNELAANTKIPRAVLNGRGSERLIRRGPCTARGS